MSPNDRDKPTIDLESMYREHGDIEPDPGLDRMIRARADEAAQGSRSRRPAPWIGGLVTASVALIAIAVVLRQAPTGAPTSQDEVPRAAPRAAPAGAEPGAVPESAARSAPPSSIAGAPRRPGTAEEARAASDPAGTRERDAFLAERAALVGDRDQKTESGAGGATEREAAEPGRVPEREAAEPGSVPEPEVMVESIRRLIEQDRIQPARRRAELLQRMHPEFALPEDVRAILPGPPGDNDG